MCPANPVISHKSQANRTPEEINEEMFEMRAAFGPGQKVVNVKSKKERTPQPKLKGSSGKVSLRTSV